LSGYPGLWQKPSGVYAVRMRVPSDIIDLIEGDATIWDEVSTNPGSSLHAWRDALTTVSQARKIKARREFKRSLHARTLSDAEPAYFELRNDLESVSRLIRTAYSEERKAASDNDLLILAHKYLEELEEASD